VHDNTLETNAANACSHTRNTHATSDQGAALWAPIYRPALFVAHRMKLDIKRRTSWNLMLDLSIGQIALYSGDKGGKNDTVGTGFPECDPTSYHTM
jgi:hypothetical protein